jgi:hypothetical protein
MTPMARSLKFLREQGWPLVGVMESWVPRARVRRDLYGIIDVLACGPRGVLAVQVTTGDHAANRVAKIAASPALPILKAANVKVMVHGWRLNASNRWTLREVAL